MVFLRRFVITKLCLLVAVSGLKFPSVYIVQFSWHYEDPLLLFIVFLKFAARRFIVGNSYIKIATMYTLRSNISLITYPNIRLTLSTSTKCSCLASKGSCARNASSLNWTKSYRIYIIYLIRLLPYFLLFTYRIFKMWLFPLFNPV